jgi:hypothetical protein
LQSTGLCFAITERAVIDACVLRRPRLARAAGGSNLEVMAKEIVKSATADNKASAIAVLTLAFAGDPATRWTWPDPKAYLAAFPRFAEAFGGAAFAKGSAHCIDGAGAALWLPPGIHPDEEAIGALMHATADVRTASDGPQVMQQMARAALVPAVARRRSGAPRARPGRFVTQARRSLVRSRRRGGLPRILQSQERPALSAARLRGAGQDPGRRLSGVHADAARSTLIRRSADAVVAPEMAAPGIGCIEPGQ